MLPQLMKNSEIHIPHNFLEFNVLSILFLALALLDVAEIE